MLDSLAHGRRAWHSATSRATKADKIAIWIALGVIVIYASVLVGGYRQGVWILDRAGHPVINDFVVFWTVGKMALKGAALSAYAWNVEHAAELATIGHPFHQLLGWYYPPTFLAIVSLPAALPYAPAFLAWGFATLALYAVTFARIANRPGAVVVACAAPWVLVELILGQNGFLSAAIIGTALLLLEKRPALSGLVLGLLSFKPQLAILFPLALAAGGYWRSFWWAAFGVALWNGLAAFLFGVQSYPAFFHAMSTAADNHLVHSTLGWSKLESLYGYARALHASSTVAWSLQLAASVAATSVVVFCWRDKSAAFELKAASLASALLIATPYLLYYDAPVLGVAVAFLLRHRAFDRMELVLMALTVPYLCGPFLPAFEALPGALLAAGVLLALAARRRQEEPAVTFQLVPAAE